jgi:hypothetical protein
MLSDYQVVIFDVTDLFLLLHFLQGQNSLLYAKLVLQTWRFCWKWSTSCTQTLSWRTHSMRWRCLSDVSCLISTYLKRSRKTVSLFWVGELYKCITLSCVVFCLFLILPSVWICSKRNLFSSGYLWIIYINSRVYCSSVLIAIMCWSIEVAYRKLALEDLVLAWTCFACHCTSKSAVVVGIRVEKPEIAQFLLTNLRQIFAICTILNPLQLLWRISKAQYLGSACFPLTKI